MEIYLEGCSPKTLSWLSLKGGVGNGGFYILFRLFFVLSVLKKKKKSTKHFYNYEKTMRFIFILEKK